MSVIASYIHRWPVSDVWPALALTCAAMKCELQDMQDGNV